MQFEEFDKKIKEAADNHHPAYDEQAWAKMNKLLDKHMPEKDERRRRFAWLFFLLFLLGGAGIFYGVQSLVGNSKETAGSSVSADRPVKSPEAGSTGIKQAAPAATDRSADMPAAAPSSESTEPVTTKPGMNLPVAGEPGPLTKNGRTPVTGSAIIRSSTATAKKTGSRTAGNKPETGMTPVFQSGSAKKSRKPGVKTPVSTENNTSSRPADPNEVTASGIDQPAVVSEKADAVPVAEGQPAIVAAPANMLAQPKKDTVAQTEAPVAPVANAKGRKSAKRSHFFFTVSAGPDASYTKDGKPGRLIPVTGAGIGYLYKERFSIRAGFYNAAKIYSAAPDAYKAPASFYNYYPYLVNVDANCRVYELPLSLGYHFGARKNHSWFASATLSSYLMKRETYNYSYKTSAWGPVQQRKWNLYNDNQHYFSVLGISAGYQRRITERISFIAEPYLRVPLQGVGYGNVKLNSAGVLFSVAVQPAALIPRKQKK